MKLSEMLAKLGYQESDELFSVYNEVEYNQLLASAQILEQRIEELEGVLRDIVDEAQLGGLARYGGKLSPQTWEKARALAQQDRAQ